jgi:hypothetical protein
VSALARAALAGASATAVLAFAHALDAPWALVAIVPLIASLRPGTGARPRRQALPGWLRALVVVSVTAAAALSWLALLHAGPPGPFERLAQRAIGGALCLAIGALSVRARGLAPGRAVGPAIVALLALSGTERRIALEPYAAAATTFAFGYLLLWPERPAIVVARGAAPAERGVLARLARVASRGAYAFATLAIATAIMRLLPLAQGRLERALLETELPGSAGTGGAGLSGGDVRVGALARLQPGDEVALRVFAEAPTLLRAHAYVRFDGRTWRAPSTPRTRRTPTHAPSPALDAALAAPSGALFAIGSSADEQASGALSVTAIVPESDDDGALPAPRGASFLRVDASAVDRDEAGLLVAEGAAHASAYAVAHATEPPIEALDDAARAAATELPTEIDPRLRDLAASIAEPGAPPRRRIARTIDAVRAHASYSLDPGPFHGRQPVAEFLFEKRRGWCEHFASATATLLRLQGIPTRYVTGWAVREDARVGDHFVVRARDAHAWVEAWVDDDPARPGRGRWLEVDATPTAGGGAPGDGARSAGLAERLAGWLARLRLEGPRALFGLARASLVLLAAVALGAALVHLRRRRASRTADRPSRASEAPLPNTARRMVAELEAEWARRGAPRPRSRTLREHLHAIATRLREDERARALRRVERIYRAAYDAGGRTDADGASDAADVRTSDAPVE